jgi:hypothetical protein
MIYIAEIWKDIIGYDGVYQVSNLGRVKSLQRAIKTPSGAGCSKERILALVTHKQGYKKAQFSKNCKNKAMFVHRLVAIAFIPNPNSFKEINHKNGIKDDNRICNLEWCNGSHNVRHAIENNLMKKRSGFENAKSRPVIRIDANGKLLGVFPNIGAASKRCLISSTTIRTFCEGKVKNPYTKTYWRYMDKEDAIEMSQILSLL